MLLDIFVGEFERDVDDTEKTSEDYVTISKSEKTDMVMVNGFVNVNTNSYQYTIIGSTKTVSPSSDSPRKLVEISGEDIISSYVFDENGFVDENGIRFLRKSKFYTHLFIRK